MGAPARELMGTLFGTGARGESRPVRVRAGPSALDLAADGMEPVRLAYGALSVELGPDDEFWVFRGAWQGRELLLYVREPELPGVLRAAGAHPSVLARLDELAAQKGSHARWQRALLVALVAGVAAALVGLYVVVPRLLDMAAARVPVEWEERLGDAAAASVLRGQGNCTDPATAAAVGEVADRLVAAAGPTPYEFKFTVIDSGAVNAFALPGGRVFVTWGLVNATDDPHEVAGVVGHEMAHVIRRHSVRNIMAVAGIRVAVAVLVGATDSELADVVPLAGQLSALAFSREQEREADEGGLDLLYAARLDPDGLPRFFDRLTKDETMLDGFMEAASTHPVSSERAASLRGSIASRPRAEVEPVATDWKGLAKRCGPEPGGGRPQVRSGQPLPG